MTKQQQEFEYYCLDRCKPIAENVTITYKEDNVIKKLYFKVGLRADIKHVDCFCLYTESDRDLDAFVYIYSDLFFDYYERFLTGILSKEEVDTLFIKIRTINIFEFTSLLAFNDIYQDFKDFLEYNWEVLNMDKLIEL